MIAHCLFQLSITVFLSIGAIQNTEKKLTNGDVKSWEYFKTEETMGFRQADRIECANEVLTFTLASKTYDGTVCSANKSEDHTWAITGEDEDELYITLAGETYMIDIFNFSIDGVKTEVLRLKIVSKVKDQPSVATVYRAKN